MGYSDAQHACFRRPLRGSLQGDLSATNASVHVTPCAWRMANSRMPAPGTCRRSRPWCLRAAARHLSFTRAATGSRGRSRPSPAGPVARGEARRPPCSAAAARPCAHGTGATLLGGVRQALEALDRSTRTLRASHAPRTVVVSTTAASRPVAYPRCPLHPHCTRHRRAHLGEQPLVNLGRDGVDIAVRYSPADRPPTRPRRCSPRPGRRLHAAPGAHACAAGAGRPGACDSAAHAARSGGSAAGWPIWLEAMQLGGLRPAGSHISSYDTGARGARRPGVALGRFPITAALVRARRLVTLRRCPWPRRAAIRCSSRPCLRCGRRSRLLRVAQGRSAARVQHPSVERPFQRSHDGRAVGSLRSASSSRLSSPIPCSAEIEPPRAATAS